MSFEKQNNNKEALNLDLHVCVRAFSRARRHSGAGRSQITLYELRLGRAVSRAAPSTSLDTHKPTRRQAGRQEGRQAHTRHVQAVTTHGPALRRARARVWCAARCGAECCGDQWESTLGPLAEAIKREWIMRLFID